MHSELWNLPGVAPFRASWCACRRSLCCTNTAWLRNSRSWSWYWHMFAFSCSFYQPCYGKTVFVWDAGSIDTQWHRRAQEIDLGPHTRRAGAWSLSVWGKYQGVLPRVKNKVIKYRTVFTTVGVWGMELRRTLKEGVGCNVRMFYVWSPVNNSTITHSASN